MSRARSRLVCLGVVFAVVLSLGVSGTAVAGESGNDSTADETFVVSQGEDCYEATALGDGSETVESFYNYSTDFDWSSEGTRHLQENQVSNLFVYHGSEGYSLVILHDKHGDGPHGSTTTFTVTGLPESGEWAVEDDDYEDQDDNFTHYDTYSEMDWQWSSDRTDGAAFRGLTAEEDVAITVEPAFNEEAAAWNSWPWSGDEENKTEAWKLLGEDGDAVTTLDMGENVTVSAGACDEPVTASLSVSDDTVTVDKSVTFDASDSTADAEIVKYHWDFDGDGEVDKKTESATVEYAYAKADEYDASVTVVDADGNEDTVSTMVTVKSKDKDDDEKKDDEKKDTEPPTATLKVPDKVTVDEKFTVKATDVTDPSGVAHVCWYYDGKTGPDGKTMEVSFSEPGTHTVSVKMKDEAGNDVKITREIKVVAADESEPPAEDPDDSKDSDESNETKETPASDDEDEDMGRAILSVVSTQGSNETVTVGEAVSFNVTVENDGEAAGSHEASLSTDGPLADDSTASAEKLVAAGEKHTFRLSAAFDEAGEYEVHLADRTFAITVTAPETETPTETETEAPTETETETPTETATETENASGQDGDSKDGSFATGQSGPGFGILSVLVAALIGVAALYRRR